MKKRSRCLFTFSCLFVGAIATAKYDCNLANTPATLKITIASMAAGVEDAYPLEDIEVAVNHLTNFCCEKNYVADVICPKKDDNGHFQDTTLRYASSPYLFDHLVDIGMRRINGAPEEQYNDASLDNRGAMRREQIRALAGLTEGAIPMIIMEQYRQARKPGKDDQDGGEPLPPDIRTKGADAITDITKNWSIYGLRNKYFATCYLADAITSKLQLKGINERINSQENRISLCLGLAQQIIAREFEYTKYIMINQTANMIKSTMTAYLDGYFARDRLQVMLSKFADMQHMFLTVNTKVQEGTKQCSK